MRGETFDQTRERCMRQHETGKALGLARWERGQRLTDDERAALNRHSMFGSDGYPLVKRGRGWVIETACYSGPIFKTKREAWCAWETFMDCLITLDGREAQARYQGPS